MILEISAYLFNQKFETFSTCIYIFKSFRNHFRILSIYAQYFFGFIIYSNKYKYYRKFYLYP